MAITTVLKKLWGLIKLFKKSVAKTIAIISTVLLFLSDSFLMSVYTFSECEIVALKFALLSIVFILTAISYLMYYHFRREVNIKGDNYHIKVMYGDIFDMESCKKVIGFDECFTTIIGEDPAQIKPTSICGQYLKKHPITDMQTLIDRAQIKPCRNKSKYNNQVCYNPGSIVPRDDFLLTAFVKLDSCGTGWLTREEYINCLMMLWKELNKHYGGKDICMPIIGSGIARIENITKQEMLDIIIATYKMSAHKIKNPAKLHIVCQKTDDFSLNEIGTYI